MRQILHRVKGYIVNGISKEKINPLSFLILQDVKGIKKCKYCTYSQL